MTFATFVSGHDDIAAAEPRMEGQRSFRVFANSQVERPGDSHPAQHDRRSQRPAKTGAMPR
jgi:hypothetical protein